jgi:hypothetical protein
MYTSTLYTEIIQKENLIIDDITVTMFPNLK